MLTESLPFVPKYSAIQVDQIFKTSVQGIEVKIFMAKFSGEELHWVCNLLAMCHNNYTSYTVYAVIFEGLIFRGREARKIFATYFSLAVQVLYTTSY